MKQHGNSMTQKLIYRSSYQKHRERLIDIRHNSTSNEFFIPPKSKISYQSTKMKQLSKTKKDEQQPQNHINTNKLQTLKDKSTGLNDPLSSNSQFKRSDRRNYNLEQQKIQITSNLQDGQQIRCFLPKAYRVQSFSNSNSIKQNKIKNYESYTTKYGSIDKNRRKSENYQAYNQIIDQGNPVQEVSDDVYFNLPQRNPNRKVLYKKTLILGAMQSCLIQICQLNCKYLIVAYIMGLQNYTIRYYLSQKQSKQLINDENNVNYDQFCKKIVVEKLGLKHYEIKIKARQNSPQNKKEKAQNQDDKQKKRLKIQNEFLKRNFYTLLKQDENNKMEAPKQTVHVDKQLITSLVARLAVPKRFFKYRDQVTTYHHVEDNKLKKESIDHNMKLSNYKITIKKALNHIKSDQPKIKSTNTNTSQILVKQSQQKITKNDMKHDNHLKKSLQLKQPKIQAKLNSKQQQKVQLYEEQYNQGFQNSQSIIQQRKSYISNHSNIDNRKNQPRQIIQQPQKQQNLYQNVYEQEFDNEEINNNKSKISSKAIQNKAPTKNDEIEQDNYEQDYEGEFQNNKPSKQNLKIDKNKQNLKNNTDKRQQSKIQQSYQEDFS